MVVVYGIGFPALWKYVFCMPFGHVWSISSGPACQLCPQVDLGVPVTDGPVSLLTGFRCVQVPTRNLGPEIGVYQLQNRV